jgi:hypothetical protein
LKLLACLGFFSESLFDGHGYHDQLRKKRKNEWKFNSRLFINQKKTYFFVFCLEFLYCAFALLASFISFRNTVNDLCLERSLCESEKKTSDLQEELNQ